MSETRALTRAVRVPLAAGTLARAFSLLGLLSLASPAFANAQTYILGPAATITYVVPTTSSPVTVIGLSRSADHLL